MTLKHCLGLAEPEDRATIPDLAVPRGHAGTEKRNTSRTANPHSTTTSNLQYCLPVHGFTTLEYPKQTHRLSRVRWTKTKQQDQAVALMTVLF